MWFELGSISMFSDLPNEVGTYYSATYLIISIFEYPESAINARKELLETISIRREYKIISTRFNNILIISVLKEQNESVESLNKLISSIETYLRNAGAKQVLIDHNTHKPVPIMLMKFLSFANWYSVNKSVLQQNVHDNKNLEELFQKLDSITDYIFENEDSITLSLFLKNPELTGFSNIVFIPKANLLEDTIGVIANSLGVQEEIISSSIYSSIEGAKILLSKDGVAILWHADDD